MFRLHMNQRRISKLSIHDFVFDPNMTCSILRSFGMISLFVMRIVNLVKWSFVFFDNVSWVFCESVEVWMQFDWVLNVRLFDILPTSFSPFRRDINPFLCFILVKKWVLVSQNLILINWLLLRSDGRFWYLTLMSKILHHSSNFRKIKLLISLRGWKRWRRGRSRNLKASLWLRFIVNFWV